MKKIDVKKTICASLAALAICPAIAAVKPTVNTYAAGSLISGTGQDYSTFSIDESQINVTSRSYYPTGAMIGVKKSGNKIMTKDSDNRMPVFARHSITIRISGTKYSSDIMQKLNAVELNVVYNLDGKTSEVRCYKPTVKNNNNNTYDLVYDVISLGRSFSFYTDEINGVTNLKCDYSSMAPQSGSTKYFQMEVTVPDGENLFISIRQEIIENNKETGCVPYSNMVKWAKMLCVYANALSETTGVDLGTLYICYDFPTGGRYSANRYINRAGDKYGLVVCSPDSTNFDLQCIKDRTNTITWGIMHEISHSYGIGVSPSDYDDNYNFFNTTAGENWDEFMVNARGLTAIQNCSNLRNVKIYDDTFGTNRIIDETYDTIMGKYKGDDLRYLFAQKLVNLGWVNLEKFVSSKEDNEFISMENVNAARTLSSYLGKSYKYNNIKNENDINTIKKDVDKYLTKKEKQFLLFANNFRKLNKICWWQSFDTNNYKSFIEEKFGKNLILRISNHLGF